MCIHLRWWQIRASVSKYTHTFKGAVHLKQVEQFKPFMMLGLLAIGMILIANFLPAFSADQPHHQKCMEVLNTLMSNPCAAPADLTTFATAASLPMQSTIHTTV